MPWYEGDESVAVQAPREVVYATMTDYARMPSWQGPLKRCDVIARRADGTAEVVEYEVATPLRSIVYRLRHTEESPASISGELIEGDIRGFRGQWRFRAEGPDLTQVECHMAIDPGVRVPGRIARLLHKTVLRKAVTDLKREAERAGR